jgi:hypothetical protein
MRRVPSKNEPARDLVRELVPLKMGLLGRRTRAPAATRRKRPRRVARRRRRRLKKSGTQSARKWMIRTGAVPILRWSRSFGQPSGLVKLIPGYVMPPVWWLPRPGHARDVATIASIHKPHSASGQQALSVGVGRYTGRPISSRQPGVRNSSRRRADIHTRISTTARAAR